MQTVLNGQKQDYFCKRCDYKMNLRSGVERFARGKKKRLYCNKADGLGSGCAKNGLSADRATLPIYHHEFVHSCN